MSLYGEWSTRGGLPVFVYRADHDVLPEAEWDPIQALPTRRHWVMVGNRSIQMQVANDGRVALFDERYSQRWLTAPDPAGTGVSLIEEDASAVSRRLRHGPATAAGTPGSA